MMWYYFMLKEVYNSRNIFGNLLEFYFIVIEVEVGYVFFY